MSEVAVNRLSCEEAEEFVSMFTVRPKAEFIPTEYEEQLGPIIIGFSGIILIDLPRENLDELVGKSLDFGMVKISRKWASGYMLEVGQEEPTLFLVYSARL